MKVTSKKIFKTLRTYATYIVFSINIIAIILLFASVSSWYVSPEKTTFFAYLGLAFPFILVINICFSFFWFILLKWKLGLVGLVCLILCWSPIFTYFPVNTSQKVIPDDTFKILTYNIKGVALKWHESIYPKDIVTYINDVDADIVCLQEFVYYPPNDKLIKKSLKTILPNYKYSTAINFRSDNSYINGMICLSKYPILDAKKLPLEAQGNGSALLHLNIKGKKVALIINHLQSNRLTGEDKQLYKDFLKESKTSDIDTVANSLRNKLGTAYKHRAKQADILANVIEKEKTVSEAVIVCGDFNDTPISYTYKTVKGDLIDSFRNTGFGPGISYNENYFWFRIDYILHSQNISSYNCTIDKVKYSDHYPLWAYLKFNDKPLSKK